MTGVQTCALPISNLDPDAPLHLPSDSADSFVSVGALHHKSVVPEHLQYNAIHLTLSGRYHLAKLAFAEDLLLAQSLTLNTRSF